jgi:cytochrome b561
MLLIDYQRTLFKLLFHHHHWLGSHTWALAFLRIIFQLKYPAIASSDFMTRAFSRVGLSAPRPIPSYPGGPMFSVSCLP